MFLFISLTFSTFFSGIVTTKVFIPLKFTSLVEFSIETDALLSLLPMFNSSPLVLCKILFSLNGHKFYHQKYHQSSDEDDDD